MYNYINICKKRVVCNLCCYGDGGSIYSILWDFPDHAQPGSVWRWAIHPRLRHGGPIWAYPKIGEYPKW